MDHQSENVVVLGPQKAESKSYKWKEAPILGAEEGKDR
jgi:hypothetical protein